MNHKGYRLLEEHYLEKLKEEGHDLKKEGIIRRKDHSG
jgi:hypothetical protein